MRIPATGRTSAGYRATRSPRTPFDRGVWGFGFFRNISIPESRVNPERFLYENLIAVVENRYFTY
jgi:hypothetical protein